MPGYQQVPGIPVPVPEDEMYSDPSAPAIAAPNMSLPSGEAAVAPGTPGDVPTAPVDQPPVPVPGFQMRTPGALDTITAIMPENYLRQTYSGPHWQTRQSVTQTTQTPGNPEQVAAANEAANAANDNALTAQRDLVAARSVPHQEAAQIQEATAQAGLRTQMEGDVQQQGAIDRMAANQRAVQGLLDEARNPARRGQLFEGPGGGGRALATGLGILFSGLQGLATQDPQAASRFIDNIIQRNLDDQIRERENTYGNAEARNNLFSMAERELGSRQAAVAATRAAMHEEAATMLEARMNANMPPILKAQLQAQIEQLRATAASERAAATAQANVIRTETQRRLVPGGPRLSESTITARVGQLGGAANQQQGQEIAGARVAGAGQVGGMPSAGYAWGRAAPATNEGRAQVQAQLRLYDELDQTLARLGELADQRANTTFMNRDVVNRVDSAREQAITQWNAAIAKLGALSEPDRAALGNIIGDPNALFGTAAGARARLLTAQQAIADRRNDMVRGEVVSVVGSRQAPRTGQGEATSVNILPR